MRPSVHGSTHSGLALEGLHSSELKAISSKLNALSASDKTCLKWMRSGEINRMEIHKGHKSECAYKCECVVCVCVCMHACTHM